MRIFKNGNSTAPTTHLKEAHETGDNQQANKKFFCEEGGVFSTLSNQSSSPCS